MSTHKKPILRYRIIDKCLRNRVNRYWSVNQLIEKNFEQDIIIKRRALLYDIENMKFDERLGYNAPIEYCRKNKGYYYTDPEYSIEKIPLSDEEFKTLANSLSFLKYKSAFKEFESVVDKLLRVGSQSAHQYDSTPIIEFEKAPYYKGEEFIDPLQKFIRAKQPVKITYQKFKSDKPEDYYLHPYFLKEYRNRWYLLSMHEELNELRTFALDRFIEIEETPLSYKECPLKNPSDYFKHILGVTVGKGPIETIILTFHPDYAPYLKTQSIHPSQEIVLDSEKEFRIQLKLIPNFELTSLILSYGRKVKVLEPLSLKELINREK